jgi:hypothetical protein
VSTLAGHFWALAGPTLLALARPSAATAAAAAAAGLISALFAFSARLTLAAPVLLATLAGAVGWSAWQWRRRTEAEEQPTTTVDVVILILWSAIAVGSIAMSGLEPIRLSEAAARMPAAIAGPASVAAWYWSASRRSGRHRIGILLALAVASVPAIVGTTWFADWFSRDRLLGTRRGAGSRALSSAILALEPVGEPYPVDFTGELRVSPSGRAVAVVEWCDEWEGEDACRTRRVWSDVGGRRQSLLATDLAFAGGDELLVLDAGTASTILRLETGSLRAPWQIDLGDLRRPRLQAEPDGRWVVDAGTP